MLVSWLDIAKTTKDILALPPASRESYDRPKQGRIAGFMRHPGSKTRAKYGKSCFMHKCFGPARPITDDVAERAVCDVLTVEYVELGTEKDWDQSRARLSTTDRTPASASALAAYHAEESDVTALLVHPAIACVPEDWRPRLAGSAQVKILLGDITSDSTGVKSSEQIWPRRGVRGPWRRASGLYVNHR